MKKQFIFLSCLLFFTAGLFAQAQTDRKPLTLPEDAVEITLSAIGGEYPIFSEDGRIYFDGKVSQVSVNVMGYDKSLVATYVQVWEAQIKSTYDEPVDGMGKREKCCLTIAAYKAGKIASWKEKIDVSKDESKPDMQFRHLQYRWQGTVGNNIIYISIDRADGDSAKALKYLDEMIAKAIKIDYSKL
jgi:hypothetical protein